MMGITRTLTHVAAAVLMPLGQHGAPAVKVAAETGADKGTAVVRTIGKDVIGACQRSDITFHGLRATRLVTAEDVARYGAPPQVEMLKRLPGDVAEIGDVADIRNVCSRLVFNDTRRPVAIATETYRDPVTHGSASNSQVIAETADGQSTIFNLDGVTVPLADGRQIPVFSSNGVRDGLGGWSSVQKAPGDSPLVINTSGLNYCRQPGPDQPAMMQYTRQTEDLRLPPGLNPTGVSRKASVIVEPKKSGKGVRVVPWQETDRRIDKAMAKCQQSPRTNPFGNYTTTGYSGARRG